MLVQVKQVDKIEKERTEMMREIGEIFTKAAERRKEKAESQNKIIEMWESGVNIGRKTQEEEAKETIQMRKKKKKEEEQKEKE